MTPFLFGAMQENLQDTYSVSLWRAHSSHVSRRMLAREEHHGRRPRLHCPGPPCPPPFLCSLHTGPSRLSQPRSFQLVFTGLLSLILFTGLRLGCLVVVYQAQWTVKVPPRPAWGRKATVKSVNYFNYWRRMGDGPRRPETLLPHPRCRSLIRCLRTIKSAA